MKKNFTNSEERIAVKRSANKSNETLGSKKLKTSFEKDDIEIQCPLSDTDDPKANSTDDEAKQLNKETNSNKSRIKRKTEWQRKRRAEMSEAEKAKLRNKAKEVMKASRLKASPEKKNQYKCHDRERRRLARICKKIGNNFTGTGNGIDAYQSNFDCFMSSLQWKVCSKCKKKEMLSCYDKKPCKDCNLFRAENGMDPGDLPDQLKDLSYIEQQLIAKVHPVVSVYRLRKGEQYKYSGQVISFPQNVQEVYNVLPQKVSDISSVLTVRIRGSDGYKDFNVRRKRVHDALIWLKNNNPFYSDVTISDEYLELLPVDGDVYTSTNGYSVDENEETSPKDIEGVHYLTFSDVEDSELDGIDFKHVPNIVGISQKEKVCHSMENNILLWPSIGVVPINEFSSPGYITMAFPHLFPYGLADYSNRDNHDISLSKYIQHLMLYYDERFAKDPRFRFFMMNSQMRWQSLNVGNVFVKKNDFFSEMTVVQLKEYLKEHPELLSHIMFYSSRLRSTKSYWKSRCGELLDMVTDLGAPTIFFTLSSADYHWKDLFRLLGVDDLNAISYADKTKLISENPLIVSTFFKLRCENFLHKCFFQKFDVVDFWYRVEFQHRGSSHIHGVVWLKNAPDVKTARTEEEKKEIIGYFDKLVSCQNPDISFRPNLVHPCQKSVSDCIDLDEDLAELVNRVQRHTKCSTSYCLRTSKQKGGLSCRFGFPKEMKSETELTEENGSMRIDFACNDCLINKYNAWVLQTWRSNIDFTAIVSEEILYRYIAKYASKCEIKSTAYDELLNNILSSQQSENHSCKKIIRKLLISTCAERDYSAQEVMFILMGYALYHCSRQFVILNLKDSVWEMLQRGDGSKNKVFIEHYSVRPNHLEEKSLLECAKHFYVKSSRWVSRKKPAVVRIFPKKILTEESSFCDLRLDAILHVPWRNVHEFDIPEIDLKNKLTSIGVIDKDFDDFDVILEWSDEEFDSFDQDDNQQNDADDWEYISKYNGKKWQAKVKDNLTNFNWSYAHDKYDLNVVYKLVEELKTTKASKAAVHVDYDLFSSDQAKVFNHFCKIIDEIKSENIASAERLIFIQGKAGYGKSFVLNGMRAYCVEQLGEGSCAVVAFSGVAAKNVDGETIHSFLRITPQYFKDLTGDELHLFQEKHSNLHVLFIDEYSLVGLRLLGMIDQRCREAKDNDEILGNLCVVMLGDVNQLGPVFDKPLYSDNVDIGSSALVQRDRLSVGTCTKADVKMLKSRTVFCLTEADRASFKDCLRICSKREASVECNNIRLQSLQNPIARIVAENNSKKAFLSSDTLSNGLSNVLYLSLGCRIMLKQNINVSLGLVNGSLGTVEDIIYKHNCGPPQLPLFVIVKFDNFDGFDSLNGCVPITISNSTWYLSGKRCSRAQLPISLSWACTIHKSQSLTLSKCEIDLGSAEFQLGLTYVAFSRVENLTKLMLVHNITLKRLNAVRYSQLFILRELFLSWLKTLEK